MTDIVASGVNLPPRCDFLILSLGWKELALRDPALWFFSATPRLRGLLRWASVSTSADEQIGLNDP